jgi:hypothetical protein
MNLSELIGMAKADDEPLIDGDTTSVKVFAIPELLESILINVDSTTLLFAQRVNRMFQDVISESQSLQKKLFFMPVASFEEAKALGLVEEDGRVLAKDSDGGYKPKTTYRSAVDAKAVINSLAFDLTNVGWGVCSCHPKQHISSKHLAQGHPASFKRMFLSQPPKRELTIKASGSYTTEIGAFFEVIEEPTLDGLDRLDKILNDATFQVRQCFDGGNDVHRPKLADPRDKDWDNFEICIWAAGSAWVRKEGGWELCEFS